jgi:hypothetical protein
MSSTSFPPPALSSRAPERGQYEPQPAELAAAVAAAAAALAASDAFVTSQLAAVAAPDPTPEPDGPHLPSLPPKASPPPRANPIGPVSTMVPITPFSLVPAAPAAPSPASAGRGRSKGGRRLFALVAALVLIAGAGAVVQLVRRANQDHVSAAPGASAPTLSSAVPTTAAPRVPIEEAGFGFALPEAPRRSTVDLKASMPGATDVKWALLQGSVLTTVQLVQMPTQASADGGDKYARAVVAAILKRPHALINLTSRPDVSGAIARYYEIGVGTRVLYVYTVVKGATVVTLISSGGDGNGAPAAFSMARASLTLDGASLGG